MNTEILYLKDKTVNQNIPGIKTFPGKKEKDCCVCSNQKKKNKHKKPPEIGRKRS